MTNANAGSELLAAEPAQTETLSESDIATEVRRIEQRLDARSRLLAATGSILGSRFFHDFHGNPWLKAKGAWRLKLALGIMVSQPFAPSGAKEMFDVKRVDDDVFVKCALTAEWPRLGSAVIEIGSCDTQDQFFTGDPESQAIYRQFLARTGDDKKKAVEMLVGHIEKKALANALSRVITAVTGLSGATWEELGHLGLALKEGATTHQYSKGATRASKAAAKQALGRVTIAALKELSKGSRAAVGGTIRYANAFPKFWKFTIKDESGECVVVIWKQEPLPDIAAAGNEVFFPKVEVREYQGNAQYVAESIELAGNEEEPA